MKERKLAMLHIKKQYECIYGIIKWLRNANRICPFLLV